MTSSSAKRTFPARDRILFSVRWGLTAALAYLVLFDQNDPIGTGELAFVGALLGSNLVAHRLDRWIARERAFVVLLGLDSGLVLLGMMLADSSSQDLVIGYFLCVLLSSLADTEERLIGLSLLATGLYAFIGLHGADELWRPAVLLRFPLLVLVTLSYGLLVTRLRAEQAARASAERRAVELESVLALTRRLASTLSTAEILDETKLAIAGVVGSARCRFVGLEEADDAAALSMRSLASRQVLTRDDAGAAAVAVPLFQGDEPLGSIIAEIDGERTAPSGDVLEFCEIAADAANLALGNARRFEELEQAERTKTDFLRNLSHEMHTPLHAILGFTEIARSAIDDPDRSTLENALERVADRAEEMSGHVERLLCLSNLTLGRERAVPAVVDLPKILSRSLREAQRAATASSVDFQLAISSGLDRVIVDGEKLERIVDCVLLNAVKFTERGKIAVAAALDDQSRLRLSVRDDGIGIPETESGRIFEDFRQVDGSTTRRFSGLGLGLSVSRRLASLLGGEITVESIVGSGSTFEIIVPVGVPTAA